MAELPHMPMFWGDYFGDTTHLTTQEHGAYLLLMGTYWLRGNGLPDDDVRLSRYARLSKRDWKAMRDTLSEFFIVEGGVWLHKRIEVDLAKVRDKVEKARNAGRQSAKQRAIARSTDVQHSSNGRSNGRSHSVATRGQPSKSKANINPLTPLRSADADAPDPKSGRASAGEAKRIGDILKGRTND